MKIILIEGVLGVGKSTMAEGLCALATSAGIDAPMLRGSAWTGKVAQYLEKTPYCVNRKLSGEDGMHQFWANYALLCDELIACSVMPVKVIDVIFGSWDKSLSNGVEFLDGQGLALGSNRLNLANEPDFKWNVRA